MERVFNENRAPGQDQPARSVDAHKTHSMPAAQRWTGRTTRVVEESDEDMDDRATFCREVALDRTNDRQNR